MKKILPNSCPDTEQLTRILTSSLGEDTESTLLEHLDVCESCQRALESLVGGADEWQFTADHLASNECSKFRSTAARPHQQEVAQLKEFLGPTDDPKMLGRLGNYEICGIVGNGSTGVVLKAHESSLNRFVAIKVLSPSYAANGRARVRFEREGRAVAAISDQHVVPIYAVDEFQGLPYIVMKYVAGGSLHQRIQQRGPLSTREVVPLAIQIATGLAAAHAAGIIHRDVKPANVLLEGNTERALVSDFGHARVVDETADTRSGMIAGTPQFMSPEQASGSAIDTRSDLFSLGSVMYASCTGNSPFRANTVFGVIKNVCETKPRRIRELNPEIEGWLEDFIQKLHQKDPNDRFESAAQVSEILGHELAHLNNPTLVAVPKRSWSESKSITASPWVRKMLLGVCAIVASLILGYSINSYLNDGQSGGQQSKDSERLALRPADRRDPDRGTKASARSVATPTDRSVEKDQESRSIVENSRYTFSVSVGGQLQLSARSEWVTIEPKDVDNIFLKVTRSVGFENESNASELFQSHIVESAIEKDSLTLSFVFDDDYWRTNRCLNRPEVRLLLVVPRKMNVDVLTTSGRIRIGKMTGRVTAKSESGRIDVEQIKGPLTAKSIHGNIYTAIAGGPILVDSPHGSVYGNVAGAFSDTIRYSSAHGHVAIGVPKDVSLSVDTKAASGKITDPQGVMHKNGYYAKDFGDGGSKIYARSDSGSINVFFLRD